MYSSKLQGIDIESLDLEDHKKNEVVNLLNELNDQSDNQSYRPPVCIYFHLRNYKT